MTAWVVLVSLKDSKVLNEAETQKSLISYRSVRQQANKMILWHVFTTNTSPRSKSESSLLCWSSEATEILRFRPETKETGISRLDSPLLKCTRTHISSGLDPVGRSYISVAQEPPDYPDMSSCVFWLFPKIKKGKKET
jgi:hypothetical protein